MGVWHINADEPTAIDYNLNFTTDDRFAPTPFRASDHDPVLVGWNLTADAAVVPTVVAARFSPNAVVNRPYLSAIIYDVPGGAAKQAARPPLLRLSQRSTRLCSKSAYQWMWPAL